MFQDFEECEVCLQRLADVAPAGSSAAVAAATEKRRLKQAQLEYKQQVKKMSSNMSKQLFRAGEGKKEESKNEVEGETKVGKEKGEGISSAKKGDKAVAKGETELEVQPVSSGGAAETSSSSGAAAVLSAQSPTLTSVPAATSAPAATSSTATTTAAASADQGLLLLLLTSLAVLLVSVFLVVWTAKAK